MRETLDFHARLYSIPKEIRRPRIEELLELVELVDKRNELTKNLSGGMKRRLEIARGLVVQPKVLFLDEPTLGLDTKTRKRIWSYIRKVNKEKGVTVLLTTHYMEEADQNSDVICIIDKGKIIANGTPESLKKSLKQDRIQLQTDDNEKACQIIKEVPNVNQVKISSSGILVSLKENNLPVTTLIDLLRKENVKIIDVFSIKPTLDDVFIQYTGRGLTEINQDNGEF